MADNTDGREGAAKAHLVIWLRADKPHSVPLPFGYSLALRICRPGDKFVTVEHPDTLQVDEVSTLLWCHHLCHG